MRSDGVRKINFAFSYSGTGLILADFELVPAGECGRDQQVAGQEHSQRDHQPFEAHKQSGVYLEPISVSHPFQVGCCLHYEYYKYQIILRDITLATTFFNPDIQSAVPFPIVLSKLNI